MDCKNAPVPEAARRASAAEPAKLAPCVEKPERSARRSGASGDSGFRANGSSASGNAIFRKVDNLI